MMTYEQFNTVYADALTVSDKDAFISDWALSSIWEDDPAADIPADRLADLAAVWDIAHMTVADMLKHAGLTQAAFATRYMIPKRTVENWCMGIRSMPEYLKVIIARDLGLL